MNKKNWDKLSKNYYDEIISPIKDSIKKNPLLEDIKKIRAKNKIAIDLGTGTGELISIITKKFKKITAIDFSEGMIKKAKEKAQNNTEFFVKDMKNLKEFKNKYDYAFSINSLLTTNLTSLNKMIKEIHNTLKPGGKLFAVLPAMEAYLYQATLITEKQISEGKTLEQAKQYARKKINEKEHDFLQSTIKYENEAQKTLYRYEVLYRFKKAKFINLEIKKIYYDWKAWKDAGQFYFPKEDPPWDWYLKCEKSKT